MINVSCREKEIHLKEYYASDGSQEYRYLLTRYWDEADKIATVIMCNPSNASYLYEDKTVMNINNFFVKQGFNKINIVNLFAFRDKESKNLKNKNNIYELDNDTYIENAVKESEIVVVAWGFGKENSGTNDMKSRIKKVRNLLKLWNINVKCFKDAKGQVNCHPRDLNLETWSLVNYVI